MQPFLISATRVVLQEMREAKELMEAGDRRGARRVLLGVGLAMARLVRVLSLSSGAICMASYLAAQLPTLDLVRPSSACQLSKWEHVGSVDTCCECRQLTPGVVWMQPPMAGFNNVRNCYSLVWPDRLHQTDRGLFEYILEILVRCTSADEHVSLNRLLFASPSFPSMRLPSCGVNIKRGGAKFTATELATLFKCVPVLLLSIYSTERIPAILAAVVGEFTSHLHSANEVGSL